MSRLLFLNKLNWYWRWPAKVAVLAFTILTVCYPYPSLLIRQLAHLRDPDGLIDPGAAALQPLIDEFRPELADNPPPREALKRVEWFVHRRVPYEWDWNVWGVSDYWPAVDEVLQAGKEDCDGRAVVAASMLRALGFEARLVGNFTHVWVETPHGETMSPAGRKGVVATDKGVRVDWSVLAELPQSAGLGVAVFPLVRELIVLLVLWWLLLRAQSRVRNTLGFALLLGGLLTVRLMCGDFDAVRAWSPYPGGGLLLAGVLLMLLARAPGGRNEAFVKKEAMR